MQADFEGWTSDELFELHAEVADVLAERLKAKKAELDAQLRQLQPIADQITPVRRAYPPVKAKFRNPDQPLETWSGRGKRPRWLDAKLRSGEQIDDFRVAS
jgi:DNA-binding protein H-NS